MASEPFAITPEPLPFTDAIEAFRSKLPLTPEQFAGLTDEAKTRAFTISGITSEDLLTETFRGIERALEEGKTYEEFEREFLPRLETAWGGERPFRLETVFQTNVQSAYQAGHYRGMTDPEVMEVRPFGMYDTAGDSRVRPAHQALDGKVVPLDDPFWDTHWPPNGFNCRCGVISLSEAQVQARGLEPASREGAAKLAKTFRVDRGFDVNPGKVAFGKILSEAEIERSVTEKGYLEEFKGAPGAKTAIDYGRPRKLPAEDVRAKLFRTGLDHDSLREQFGELLGGESLTLQDPTGQQVVLSNSLLEHLTLDGRERFLPLLPDLITSPQEVWVRPLKGEGTGKIVLRRNYVKAYRLDKDRTVVLIADSQRGVWTGYTTFTTANRPHLKVRSGLLLHPK